MRLFAVCVLVCASLQVMPGTVFAGEKSKAHITRGIALYNSENYLQAGVEFRKGLEAITDTDSRFEIIKLLNMMTTMFTSAEEIVLYRKWQSAIKDGDYDDAIEHAAKALELNPRNVLFYYNLAYAWMKYGNNQKAIYYLEEGRKIYPAYYPIMVRLMILYHVAGQHDGTRKMLYDYAFFLGLQKKAVQ
ncbi:MAG: tetratricopeptide repeat protein [Spirochaetota bacterium]